MKKNISLIVLLALHSLIFGQINMSDSTAQVVGYWDLNESLTYIISNQKFQIQEGDTLSSEFEMYEVDITVIDSTADSYTIKWHYRDYYLESDDEIRKRLASILSDIDVIIRTSELGAFIEVVNWEEIRNYIMIGTSIMKEEYKDTPNMDKVIEQVENLYQTKEGIERATILEILQFYFFHGVKYKLSEKYTSNIKSPNLLGGEPFNAQITLWLDEINPDENNSVFHMHQIVDSTELTNATFEYLSSMAETLNAPPPIREEFPTLQNEIKRKYGIHGSGWLYYSIESKEVKAMNIKNIEKRIIELK
jgi:hypothetical protein